MSDLPTLYVDPDAPERGAFTEQTCGDAPPTVVRYVPASVADALRAELARVRELGLDATDRAERLASALTDLRAENERLRRERDAKAEPEHPDFKHQSPRVAIEVWNKQLRNALGLLTHNEHPISETADAVSDVLRLVSVLREQVEALRRERDALIQRRFPIMDGPSIPWSVIAPHEAQAQRNHDQTLELLAQRGGLGAIEAVAVLEDQAYPRGRDVQAEKARCLAVLNAINDKHAALAARAEKAEAERDEWKAKAEQCDDCENFAGIRVCTGCWAKHVAAARDAARARVAELEAQVADIKRGLRDALENWDNSRRASACTACRGSGGTCDAGGNLTEPCVGCGGSGSEVVRLTNYVAHIEKWKANAELVGLRAIEERLAAEAAAKADQTRIAALALAMGHARDTLGSLGCIGHEGDEESGAHDPDCRGCAVEASVAHIEDALSGGTAALDAHDAALIAETRKKIAQEVESHVEDVDSMHWRQAHQTIAWRIAALKGGE